MKIFISPNKPAIIFTTVISLLIIISGAYSLSTPDFYFRETPNWAAQSIAQDMIDLFVILPVMILSLFIAIKGNRNFWLMWGGCIIYLLYTYIIYCFDVHFNRLFIIYCLTFGSVFYAAIFFFYKILHVNEDETAEVNLTHKITGIYFIIVAILFYFLWISDILPNLRNESIPKSLQEVGLPTNAVHVIDLSIFLPLLFICGIAILRRKKIGQLLGCVLLTFCILMDITIAALTFFMFKKGLVDSMSVCYIMAVLTGISLALLILNFSSKNKTPLVSSEMC
jgi:hypothetical protein